MTITDSYFNWKELSDIKYFPDKEHTEKEDEKKIEAKECYGKEKLKNYYIHNYLHNMYLQSDYDSFENEYKQIRRKHPYQLKGIPFSRTPFDYFIKLFLDNEENKPNVKLLFNCFQYFYKKKQYHEEAKLVWQYAHILKNLLSNDDYRFEYSYEQLEPYRKLVGLYERKINYDNDDEQMLLNHIFQNEIENDRITRILMLSATPFRMYDNNDEDSQKNASIIDVCDFLDQNAKNNVTGKLIGYKNSLLNYSNSSVEIGEVKDKKELFEQSMNSIFTRMERYAVLRDMNKDWFENMVSDGNKASELPCGQIPELKDYLQEINNMKVERPFINFAVDSPYMGSFMHSEFGGKTNTSGEEEGYKWKADWKEKYKEIEYKADSKVYISADDFKNNEKPLGLWHGVFNETLIKLLDLDNIKEDNSLGKDDHPGASRLLWIPSCVSGKELKGPFEEHKDYGKTIIFSRYMQTPRMLACLISYESRRRLCKMIECEWEKDDNHKDKCFKEYVKSFQKKKDESEKQEVGESTYLLLSRIIKDYRDGISKELLKNNVFKGYFKSAIEKFCDKKSKTTLNDSKNGENLVIALAKAFADKVILNDEQGLLAIWASYGFPDEILPDDDDTSKSKFLNACVNKILCYCEAGALSDVLDEWFYICYESNQDFGEFIGLKKGEFLSFIKQSRIKFDLYKQEKNGKIKEDEETKYASLYFARCIGMSKDDDNINAVKGLQQSFNSPFAPFVFATTSMGQEGLDFHYYADRIVHWKLPSNPVDFEQREGRINRYHCQAIRKKIIEWWGDNSNDASNGETEDVYSIFENAFKKAKDELIGEQGNDSQTFDRCIKKCEMIPDWILMKKDKTESVKIKRIVPYFYLSKMAKAYNRNLKILQLYRTVIGQADPEEVMERLMSGKDQNNIKDLFVDFSPYSTIK